MICEHDLADREGAVADGMCPICIAAEIEQLRSEMGRAVAVAVERERCAQELADAKDDALRLHREKMVYVEEVIDLRIKLAAERERCAQIAENFTGHSIGVKIAAAIRKGE